MVRRASVAALAGACALAAIAVGGIHRETITAAAGLALAALGLSAMGSRTARIDAFGWLIGALLAATALQLVPLPMSWLEALSPASAETWAGARAAAGVAPDAAAPVSIDPDGTWLGLVWLAGILGAYLAAWHLSRRRTNGRRLLLLLPILGTVLVLVGGVQTILGLDSVLGIYAPQRDLTAMPFFSTFVNENHLAAFLNLGAPIALVYASKADQVETRAIAGVAFAIIVGGIVLTFSRAGVMTLLLSVGLVLAAGVGAGRRLALVALLAVALAVAVVGTFREDILRVVDVSSLDQVIELRAPRVALRIAARWPWTGSGCETFAAAGTQVNDTWPGVTFSHAHNTPLQLLAEYGWLVGGAVLLLSTVLLVRTFWKRRADPMHLAAAAGLVAVGIHNLVDFNLDMLGVAMPAALLVGVLRSSRDDRGVPGFVLTAAAAAALAGVLVAGLSAMPEPGPRRDRFTAQRPDEALSRLPADYLVFLRAGVERENVALIRHAHRLFPVDPSATIALALRVPRDEALALIRQTLQGAWGRLPRTLEVLHAMRPTAEEVLDALPEGGRYVALYLAVAGANDGVVRAALKRYPEDPDLLRTVGEMALDAGSTSTADEMATRLMALGDPAGYRVLARVFRARGQHYFALHMFLAAGDPRSQLDAAESALAAGLPGEALSILDGSRLPPELFSRYTEMRDRARSAARAAPVDMGPPVAEEPAEESSKDPEAGSPPEGAGAEDGVPDEQAPEDGGLEKEASEEERGE